MPAHFARVPGRPGRVPDDFALLPTAFRWVPSEDLELPFESYEIGHGRRDRRLQPDAVLEDPARRCRYLVEYETGSASVRSEHHKSATLAKICRYAEFCSCPLAAQAAGRRTTSVVSEIISLQSSCS